MADSMVDWATQLVSELTPDRNVYGSHPTFVQWADPGVMTQARNRSVCSSFLSHLLEKTYGYTPHDIGAWFGVPIPQAKDYHATIAAEHGFKRVFHAWAIEPGDVIAIAYPAGSHPTGHVMLAVSTARERVSSEPIEDGTRQFEVDVVDSANSGHGTHDTRYRHLEKSLTGAGRGTLRIYVSADDMTAGYSWSVLRLSTFRPERERRMAIGRYDAASAPAPSGSIGTYEPQVDDGGTIDDAAPDNAE